MATAASTTAAGTPLARSVRQRWSTASELLRLLHANPGVTRRQACEELSLASGAAAELIERLRAACLLAEAPARRAGRGRPTTVLGAHPRGPLALVVDLRNAGWSVLTGDLAGTTRREADGTYGDEAPERFLPRVARQVAAAEQRAAGRVRAVVAVVAGTTSGTRLLQFSTRGWREADLRILTRGLSPGLGIPLLVGNDATLGGLAEARTGAARGARAALHLMIDVGIGGVLLLDGQPVTGARGAAGEYGHLPFGDARLRCPCGAQGCWDLTVDGRALARHLREPEPGDPVAYARRLLDRAQDDPTTPARALRAVEQVARSLGAGIAGLVNLHDPDVVTLGGLAPSVRATAREAFDRAYLEGLMAFHREDPPPVRDGAHSEDGPVRGAVSLGVDEITSPAGLARWGRSRFPAG